MKQNKSEQTPERIFGFLSKFRSSLQIFTRKIITTIDGRPLGSFFILIFAILVLIIVGNFLRRPITSKDAVIAPAKEVTVYSIGSSAKLRLSARIEKSGVVRLVAQTPGIVQQINKFEGAHVNRGESIFWLSSNYQGGTVQTVTREIATKSYSVSESNYLIQKELLGKRREIADKSDTQADALRNIINDSLAGGRDLIALDEDILSSITSQLDQLIANNTDGSKDAEVLQTKQAKAGIMTAINGLKNGQRNSEYQAFYKNEPTVLSQISHEVALKQLDLEEKALNLNRELASLNLKLAQISEAVMYPASPVNGAIERVHVQVGQAVNPGTLLATITGTKNVATAIVSVSSDIAKAISRLEKSVVYIGGKSVELSPRYISSEPTDGNLHTVLFTIPEEYTADLANGVNIAIDIPIGGPKTVSSVPFIPLDAVYQTQTTSYIYIASPSATGTYIAQNREVQLGDVFGSYVGVNRGIVAADQIILDRQVIDGDAVTIK